MDDPILQVRGLDEAFAGHPVLTGIEFDLYGGEILGLVGPNGAGKTTLLRSLVSVVQPDSGNIRIAGHEVRQDPVEARRHASYLPGETSLYAGMRGREMLDFARSFFTSQDSGITQELAEAFPLPLQQRIKQYSAGMKQKLALRIALNAPTPLFLLDEPDRALDKNSRQALYRLLLALKQQGHAILISSHHLAELSEVADRCIYLVHGRIASEDRVQAARQRLSLVLRARLPGRCDKLDLPDGIRILEQPPELHLEADHVEDMDRILDALLPLRPSSLEYGRPSLQEVYDELYLGEGSP